MKNVFKSLVVVLVLGLVLGVIGCKTEPDDVKVVAEQYRGLFVAPNGRDAFRLTENSKTVIVNLGVSGLEQELPARTAHTVGNVLYLSWGGNDYMQGSFTDANTFVYHLGTGTGTYTRRN